MPIGTDGGKGEAVIAEAFADADPHAGDSEVVRIDLGEDLAENRSSNGGFVSDKGIT